MEFHKGVDDINITFKSILDYQNIFCHLLTIQKKNQTINIVIDVGIDDNFDYSIYTDDIRKQIVEADCILITSFDSNHFGAVGLFATQKIYCTVPTAILGKILLDNAHQKIIQLFKNKKILNDLNLIMIKYAQPFMIQNAEICGFNAGNSIGNILYKIQFDTKVIAVGYNINHKKDNFLNGFSTFFNADVFITNSIYSLINEDQLEARNAFFKNLILKATDKIIFVCNASRLIELLLSVENDICVVTNIKLMDRIKSMVEWTGISESFIVDFNIDFCKISQIKTKCIVVISDYINSVYLGEILSALNNNNINIIWLNNDNLIDQIPHYKISYKLLKKQQSQKTEKAEPSDNCNSVENLDNVPWYEKSQTIFLNNSAINIRFPPVKLRKPDCEYGETIKFEFSHNLDDSDNIKYKNENEEEMEVENISNTHTNITLTNSSNAIFLGVSSLHGLMYIISQMQPKYIILTNDNCENSQVTKLFLNKAFPNINTFICDNTCVFLKPNPYKMIDFVSNIKQSDLTTISNKQIAFILCKYDQDNVVLEKPSIKKSKNICLTDASVENIKSILIENGLHVKIVLLDNMDHRLIINDDCELIVKTNQWIINSSNNNLLYYIRDILYKKCGLFPIKEY